jgi:hypothetical protein
MPDATYDGYESFTEKELFEQVMPLLDSVVRRAFLHYRHPPTPEDVGRFR